MIRHPMTYHPKIDAKAIWTEYGGLDAKLSWMKRRWCWAIAYRKWRMSQNRPGLQRARALLEELDLWIGVE